MGTTCSQALGSGAREKKRAARGHRATSVRSPEAVTKCPARKAEAGHLYALAGRSEGQTALTARQPPCSLGDSVTWSAASAEPAWVPLRRTGAWPEAELEVGGAAPSLPLRLRTAHPEEAEPW